MKHPRTTLASLVLLPAFTACATRPTAEPPAVHAVRYRIEVADDGLALAHGATYVIDELYFPDQGVACNIEWQTMTVVNSAVDRTPHAFLRAFATDAGRAGKGTNATDVMVPHDLAMAIVEQATRRTSLAQCVLAAGLLPPHEEPRTADTSGR